MAESSPFVAVCSVRQGVYVKLLLHTWSSSLYLFVGPALRRLTCAISNYLRTQHENGVPGIKLGATCGDEREQPPAPWRSFRAWDTTLVARYDLKKTKQRELSTDLELNRRGAY